MLEPDSIAVPIVLWTCASQSHGKNWRVNAITSDSEENWPLSTAPRFSRVLFTSLVVGEARAATASVTRAKNFIVIEVRSSGRETRAFYTV